MSFPFFSALGRRLWKRGWRLVTVVVVMLLAHSFWAWLEVHRFEGLVERTRPEERRQDWPAWMTMAPAENAARYYEAAWALTVPERRRGGPRDEQSWMNSMAPAMEMFDRAAALPACEFSPYARTPSRVHDLAKAVSTRTRELIRNGKRTDAVASLTSSLLYLRVFSSDVSRVSPHSRGHVVERFLTDMHDLIEASSSAELGRVRDLIDAENRPNHIERTLLIERDWTLRRVRGEIGPAGGPSLGIDRWLLRPLVWRWGASSLAFEGALIEASRAPWPDRMDKIVRTPPPRSHVARMRVRWLTEGSLGIARLTAKSHAMAVCLRIEEYRRTHGALPETLEQLQAASGEKELPVDPFTGLALRYRRADGAYLVYSVGEDGKDDGGAVATRSGPAKDYGYRIQVRK